MRHLLVGLLFAGSTSLAVAAESAPPAAPSTDAAGVTDPSYLIASGDSITVTVYGESDLGASQRLDTNGKIRLPLLGDVTLAGKSVREAEHSLESLYKERELLKNPLVSISVVGFAIREVTIFGAVRSPGVFPFPKEKTSMDIVDLIARIGGFQPVAKANSVRVTRRLPDGTDTEITVDVESMINGKKDGKNREFAVLPGDRINVPERVF